MNNISEEIGIPVTHVELVRDRTIPFRKLKTRENYVALLHELLDNSPNEKFITIYLNDTMIVGAEVTAIGQNHMVAIGMGEIFRGAILAGAGSIVIGHNHTNDDPHPSDADINMTDVAFRAGMLMGIPLVDHIIVSPNGDHFSMVENGASLERRVMDMAAKNLLAKMTWDMKNLHKLPGMVDLNDKMDRRLKDFGLDQFKF